MNRRDDYRLRVLGCALLLIAVSGADVRAQDPESEYFISSRFVEEGHPATIDDLEKTCEQLAEGVCDYRPPITETACRPTGREPAGSLGAADYTLLRFVLDRAFDDEDDGWTCSVDIGLLLETSGDSLFRPVWTGTSERQFEFLNGVQVARAGGAELMTVRRCLNGTGGCYERLSIRDDGRWRPLERDSTWDEVYTRLPAGYRLHKSPFMELGELTWEQHLAGPGDGNCCPSGRLYLDLAVVNGKLSVRDSRIEISSEH